MEIKITIEIEGHTHTLTKLEAEELYTELGCMLGKQESYYSPVFIPEDPNDSWRPTPTEPRC